MRVVLDSQSVNTCTRRHEVNAWRYDASSLGRNCVGPGLENRRYWLRHENLNRSLVGGIEPGGRRHVHDDCYPIHIIDKAIFCCTGNSGSSVISDRGRAGAGFFPLHLEGRF